MPISQKSLSGVFHSAPAKAALAVSGAALASGALLAFPATASAASNSANLIIRPSHSRIVFPTFSFPVPPSTGYPSVIESTGVSGSGGGKKHSDPSPTDQGQFNYVSTFTPAPAASSAPPNTASAACLANGQPVSGAGGDLDLPGIKGTSQDAGHVGALPINALGPAAMLPPQIDSTNLGQLKVTRPVDAISANLAMVASSGYRFPCVHVEIGPGNGYTSAEYALVNAGLVADDRLGGTETLTWTYSTILWTYTVPGSTAVHQGSGQINAQPGRTSTSLVKDSKLVVAGTIGLTLVVALGLLMLYIVGKRRSRARYRARYYRRTALRVQRAATVTEAMAVPVMYPAERIEPGEMWEPQPTEAVPPAEATEAVEVGEVSEPAEAESTESHAAESETAESEAAESETAESETAESEAAESETAETEAAALGAVESGAAEPEAERAQSEAVDAEVPESEAAESETVKSETAGPETAEPDAAADETETGDAEADTDEARSEAAAAGEEAVTEDNAAEGDVAEGEVGADAATAEVTAQDTAPEADGAAAAAQSKSETSAELSEAEGESATGDEHEPAAAH